MRSLSTCLSALSVCLPCLRVCLVWLSVSVVVVRVSGQQLDVPGASPLENPRFLEDLLQCLRREDVKARFTADRLVFLLVETERTVAETVMERVKEKLAAVQRGESSDLCFGIGYASFPGDGGSSQDLFSVADAHAKARLEAHRDGDGHESEAEPQARFDGAGEAAARDRERESRSNGDVEFRARRRGREDIGARPATAECPESLS